MVERAVRMNTLTSLEQITHFTKAGGGCGTCAEQIEAVLFRVNAAMVSEGALSAEEAFDPKRAANVKKPKHKASPLAPKKPAVAAGTKLTTVQRIRLIEQSLEELRPVFRQDGGDCELVDVEEDRVFVKFSGACRGCQLESVTLQGVQERLMERLGQPLRVIPVQAH